MGLTVAQPTARFRSALEPNLFYSSGAQAAVARARSQQRQLTTICTFTKGIWK